MSCVISTYHYPAPLRYVKHHILPEVCGGKATPSNLVDLCDNCHYAIHKLLYQMKQNNGQVLVDPSIINRKRLAIAKQGYELALAAGVVNLIPRGHHAVLERKEE